VELAANVFDVWTFQRSGKGTRFLLLLTSPEKADRHFNIYNRRFSETQATGLYATEKGAVPVPEKWGRSMTGPTPQLLLCRPPWNVVRSSRTIANCSGEGGRPSR